MNDAFIHSLYITHVLGISQYPVAELIELLTTKKIVTHNC